MYDLLFRTGFTLRGSNPGGGKGFSSLPKRRDLLWDPHGHLFSGCWVLPRRQNRWGVKLTTRLSLVSRFNRWSSTSAPPP